MSLTLSGRVDRPVSAFRYGSMGRRAKAAVMVGVVTLGVVLPASAALAEGSWNSSLSGVRDGFRTRNWTDNNNDSAGTTTTLKGCSSDNGATFNLTVNLRKDNTGPDTSYGTKNFSACNSTTVTGNWGDVARGSYFEVVHTYDFGTVSASTYNVAY